MRLSTLRAAWFALPIVAVLAPAAASQTAPGLDLGPSFRQLSRLYAANTVSLLEQRRTSVWDGIGWRPNSRSVFAFDGFHRSLENIDEWSITDWVPARRNSYTGNPFELITLVEQWDPTEGEYVPFSRTDYQYAYDTQTNESVVSEERMQRWHNDTWVDDRRTTYEIGEDLTVTGWQIDLWFNSEWQPSERSMLVVEESQVVQTTQQWDGAQWVNVDRVFFSYPTLKQLFENLAEVGKQTREIAALLFATHLLPTSERHFWENDAWTPLARHEILYDFATGKPLFVLHHSWDGAAWMTPTRLEFTYEGDVLTKLTLESDEGGENWVAIVEETYEYDLQGKIVRLEQFIDLGEGLTGSIMQEYTWRHVTTSSEREEVPVALSLSAAYPNPFNPTTRIDYQLRDSGPIRLNVYDAVGRHVATLHEGVRAAGAHHALFDAAGLPSGLYQVRLEAEGARASRLMTLSK